MTPHPADPCAEHAKGLLGRVVHPIAIVYEFLYRAVFSDLSAPSLWPITYFEPMWGLLQQR